jgi:hypothetical protein
MQMNGWTVRWVKGYELNEDRLVDEWIVTSLIEYVDELTDKLGLIYEWMNNEMGGPT